ncbi:MAG TPA: pyrimidine-nucleoside phosphorylase, partial [Lactobacillus sp.]|nr:pyrimidine-nucleoside phosphorylase [Lactobacillus sp.]
KIASGTDALVLDVKTGSGAFMKTEADSVALAKELVEIGKSVGMKAMAVISDMNQPLGNAIGNALEIAESIELLRGDGPADLLDLVLTIGSQMVVMAGKATDLATARTLLQSHIDDGSALAKFKDMIEAQGGDGSVIDQPTIMPQAQYQFPILAAHDGVITKMKADEMGIAAMMLGGGRQKKDDQLDYAVGLTLAKKVGDTVHKGDTILTIHSNREDITDVEQLIAENVVIGDHADPLTLIHEVIK